MAAKVKFNGAAKMRAAKEPNFNFGANRKAKKAKQTASEKKAAFAKAAQQGSVS
jgi:hypothetical protein